MNPESPRRDHVRVAVTIIVLLLVLALLWYTRVLVLLTALAALLGIAAKPAVDWLEQRRIKRGVGSPLVVLGTALLILGVALWSAPTVIMQVNTLRVQVPAAIDKVDSYLEREHKALLDAVLPADTIIAGGDTTVTKASGRLGKLARGQLKSAGGIAFGAVTSAIAVAAGLIYVAFLAMYLAMDPFSYRRGILLLVPMESRNRMALVFDAVTATLRKWLGTQFIAMVVIGLVTTIALLALQVKAAIPLGILAGILEFVPNLGPIMSAAPAALIAFADSPQKAFFVLLAYWAIQFLENNLLIPHLMKEELDLPPALTLLWQALMAILFGVLGLFVAVPILAAGFVSVRFLYVRGDVPPHRRPRGSRTFKAVSDEGA